MRFDGGCRSIVCRGDAFVNMVMARGGWFEFCDLACLLSYIGIRS